MHDRKMRFSTKIILLSIFTLAVIAAGIIGAKLFQHAPIIPNAVQKQVSFGIYYPKDELLFKVTKDSISYNSQQELLSYTGTLANGTKLSVNQQATPESFVDIPQAYDKFINSLQAYSVFDTVNGKVSLTHPRELRGAQSAVLNGKGTLLFAGPDKAVSNQEWRKFFNNLQILPVK